MKNKSESAAPAWLGRRQRQRRRPPEVDERTARIDAILERDRLSAADRSGMYSQLRATAGPGTGPKAVLADKRAYDKDMEVKVRPVVTNGAGDNTME
jgi:hypothetical protein